MRRSRASAHTGSNHCRQTGAPFRCRIRSLASIIRVLSTSSNRSEDTPEAHGIGPKDLGISRSSLDHGWSDTRTNGPRIRTERRSRRVSPRFIVSIFRADETGHVPIVSNVRRKCENPCLVHSNRPPPPSIPLTLAHQWAKVQPTAPCNSDVGHLGFCFLINTRSLTFLRRPLPPPLVRINSRVENK